MKRDLPVPEKPEVLRLPLYRILVPIFGVVNIILVIPGVMCFAVGKILATILRKLTAPLLVVANKVLLQFTKYFFNDPKDTSALTSYFLLVGFLYPVLLWNMLSPFAADLPTAVRVLCYCMAVITYGLEFEGLGLGHLEAHSFWIKGGGIVKPQWRFLFDRFGEHFFCPLVGISPGMPTYTHCLVHHKFGNNLEDPQSTLWFDRTSLRDFFFYYCPIMLYNRHWGMGAVIKMHEYGQTKYAQAMSYGINRLLFMHGVVAMVNLKFYLCVFLPICAANTTVISAAEWAMHAFLDPDNVHCTPTVATPVMDTNTIDGYRLEPYHIVHHALNTGYYSAEDKFQEKEQMQNYLQSRDHQDTTPLYIFNLDKKYGAGKWTWAHFFQLVFRGDIGGLREALVWTGKGPRPADAQLEEFLLRSLKPLDISKYSMERLKEQQLVGPADLKDKKAMKLSAAAAK